MLSVKDIRVAGTGDYGMRRPLPTQAGDEPLASRSLRPRYIFLPPRGLKFFRVTLPTRSDGAWILAPYRGTGQAFDHENDERGGGNDESGEWWDLQAHSKVA